MGRRLVQVERRQTLESHKQQLQHVGIRRIYTHTSGLVVCLIRSLMSGSSAPLLCPVCRISATENPSPLSLRSAGSGAGGDWGSSRSNVLVSSFSFPSPVDLAWSGTETGGAEDTSPADHDRDTDHTYKNNSERKHPPSRALYHS